MVSREPTLAKKVPTSAKQVPRKTRDGFKRANLGKEGPKDRLEMVSREPT